MASLSPTPRTLCLSWLEWTAGIGGRKAASVFAAEERDSNKFRCCRRKVVWDVISSLIRTGITANVAIDCMCQVCGVNSAVTQVINRLQEDKNNDDLVTPTSSRTTFFTIFTSLRIFICVAPSVDSSFENSPLAITAWGTVKTGPTGAFALPF